MMTGHRHHLAVFFAAVLPVMAAMPAHAQQTVKIDERFTAGDMYRVSVRVELAGSLQLPPEKGQSTGKKLTIKGHSSIDYAERILKVEADGKVKKTIRNYKRMEFERKVGDQVQKSNLRAEVARLVILRHKQMEVPFSPDGPLLWGEIDLVRTDVFTPALAGLLPDRAVRVGDRWAAATSAVQELTDFEQLEEGSIACKLEQLTTLAGHRQARISFKGTIVGMGDDGRSKQQLEGYFYFDLAENHISYLSMHGVHSLLDKDGKAAGTVEGNFVLTRQPLQTSDKLSDAALRRLTLNPNDDNTQLLYDDPALGIRFLYSRRWRVAGVRGRQLGLDENGGSGILLTVEPPKRVPTGQQFLQESRQWLQKQKAVIVRTDPVRIVQRSPRHIENFSLDVKIGKQQFRMYYFVVRQSQGGIVIAARLMKNDLANLQRDVQRLAMSAELTKKK